jgi:hypothetical protein
VFATASAVPVRRNRVPDADLVFSAEHKQLRRGGIAVLDFGQVDHGVTGTL